MKFILILKMSSAFFLPTTMSITQFDSEATCLVALNTAKKEWEVIDQNSRCVSLDKTVEMKLLQDRLEVLKREAGVVK